MVWIGEFTIYNAFAPLIAAGLVALQEQGVRGLQTIAQRLLPKQISWRIITLIVSPFLLLAVALMILKFVFGKNPGIGQIGKINYFDDLGIVWFWLLWVSTLGLGEEVGWRGYLLPKLVDQFGFRQATVILGLVWSCWYSPQCGTWGTSAVPR